MAYTPPWWNVGPGISAAMDAAGDSPAGPSSFKNYDGALKLLPEPLPKGTAVAATIEECWGSRGLYRAENFSGAWRVAGPFAVAEV